MVECLVVCQARDGSTSLRNIVHSLFFYNGEHFDFGYVSDTFELWPAILDHLRHGDTGPLYRILSSWNQKVEISHGLGFVLPAVRAILGKDLKVIRVVRDPEDHVRSLVNQSQIDPEHPGTQTVIRPTAVDLGEMDESAWSGLSLDDRFRWYVNKQTEMTDRHIALFSSVLTISTDELSDVSKIQEIGHFINPSWPLLPSPTHVHKLQGLDVSGLTSKQRRHVEHVWQNFDISKASSDSEYALKFVISEIRERYSDKPWVASAVISRVLEDCQLLDAGKTPVLQFESGKAPEQETLEC